MYILTIFRIMHGLDIEWQQAADTEQALKAAAITWMQEYAGWESDDNDMSVDDQFAALEAWLDGGEADDPQILIRKSDK